MKTNNFNDALFMDFLTIEDRFSQLGKEKLKQWGMIRMGRWRRDYAEDARRTFNRIIRDQSRVCEIEPKIVHDHWASNWS
jgi:hypothetical protein